MTSADRIKDQQRKHWNIASDGWAAWLEWIERNFAPVTEWLREAAGWKPGARVLDVACGAGYPALTAAVSVRPGGRVVATDISPQMIAVAARHAHLRGVDNIDFLEMDAEHLQFADNSFDAVTNAYGLMFCPDTLGALKEAHRVLKPGGRCALVTWDEPSKSPYFTVILRVASTFLSLPPTDPAAPGPFRLAAARHLESMLRTSGFSDVRVDSYPMTVECASVAEYCQIFADVAWKTRIAALSNADAARFGEAVANAAEPFINGGHVHLVATSLCASGRK
jgi:ubiquinone/menaquinone biosynthesis C-methylase UbiE